MRNTLFVFALNMVMKTQPFRKIKDNHKEFIAVFTSTTWATTGTAICLPHTDKAVVNVSKITFIEIISFKSAQNLSFSIFYFHDLDSLFCFINGMTHILIAWIHISHNASTKPISMFCIVFIGSPLQWFFTFYKLGCKEIHFNSASS